MYCTAFEQGMITETVGMPGLPGSAGCESATSITDDYSPQPIKRNAGASSNKRWRWRCSDSVYCASQIHSLYGVPICVVEPLRTAGERRDRHRARHMHSCEEVLQDAEAAGGKHVISKSDRSPDQLINSLKKVCIRPFAP